MILSIDGIDREIEFDHIRINGVPAKMAFGMVMEQAEPDEIEILDAWYMKDGEKVQVILTDEQIRELQKEAEDYYD